MTQLVLVPSSLELSAARAQVGAVRCLFAPSFTARLGTCPLLVDVTLAVNLDCGRDSNEADEPRIGVPGRESRDTPQSHSGRDEY